MTIETGAPRAEQAAGIPAAGNFALAGFYTAVQLYQFFVLPVWLLPFDSRWAWSLLPLVFLNNPYWSLIHETIHDLFNSNRKVNLCFGRALSVMFGSPFRILRMSHLLHHKLNRTPMEATELYERGKVSAALAGFGYFFQILGGLYLVEFLSPMAFLLPRRWVRGFKDRFIKSRSVTGILMQNWTRDDGFREIRLDGLLIIAWFGLSLICYGNAWPLLLGVLLARALFISFLDNVYHYRTPVDEIFYASNLRLPAAAARILLNFNFHGIHHKNPAIPWSALPAVFRSQGQIFQDGYFAAAARQLRGPVAIDELPTSR